MDAEAKRAYDRNYHASRSPEKKQHKMDMQRKRARKNILEIRQYKAQLGCADCGERDPIVLEFDHRDQAEKVLNIGDCSRTGWSIKNYWKRLLSVM